MAKRLTPLGLQNIRPGTTRREISDGGSGLFAIIQPSGRRGWCVRYRFHGIPRKLTLDSGLTLAGARRAAADALLEVERGVDPALEKKATRAAAKATASQTLQAIAEAHLKREESKPADKRLRTIDQRRATVRAADIPEAGQPADPSHPAQRRCRLLDDVEATRGGRMADEVLSALRIVFDWHARRDDDFSLACCPRHDADEAAGPHTKPRFCPTTRWCRVWQAAEAMAGPFGRYVQFLLLTACSPQRGGPHDRRRSEGRRLADPGK